jgi:transposase-like protein
MVGTMQFDLTWYYGSMYKKTHTAKFKFESVKETIEKNNVGEVARSKGLNANLLSTWRKQFLDHGAELFESNNDKEKLELKKQIARLEQLVGKKEVELGLLKNFFEYYESRSGK